MNFTLFITVLLTAITLVLAAFVIAKLIGPRSYNPVRVSPSSVVSPPAAAHGCP
jgi:NADH-quinone oxidoreductase subunit A